MNNFPMLDLHGEDYINSKIKTKDFILESYKLGKQFVSIIHGKGLGIVKKAVHEVLKNNDLVLSYKTDMFNDGVTLVELKRI